MPTKIVRGLAAAIALIVTLALSTQAGAGLFVTTGQTGAQVQDDVNHTQAWGVTPSSNVDINGALFDMKIGPHTVDNITFDIIQGTYSDYLAGAANYTLIASIELSPSRFTQSFTPVYFELGNPTYPVVSQYPAAPATQVTLNAGVFYTGVLHSNAADTQSTAYFIKGGSASNLFITTDTSFTPYSSVQLTNTTVTATIPTPPTLLLMALGLIGLGLITKMRTRA